MRNKLMLITALPIMACAITSCNRNKSATFKEALDLVVNRYDEHALDYVRGNYIENIDKCFLDLSGNVTNTIGTSYPLNVQMNLPSVQTKICDLPTAVLDSSMLKTVESAYNMVAKATLDQFTNFKLNKEYLINNNCLTLKIGTDDNLFSWIALANNVLNIDILRDEIPYASKLDIVYGSFNVTIDPLSLCDGKCYLSASTDDCGFISNVSFVMNGYIDLNINLIGKQPPFTEMSYYANLVGNIDINVNLNLEFAE